MKKWVVLFAGIILQTILGGIYAWSAFVPSLTENYGFSKGQCGLVFGVMIAVFSVSTIPAGYFLNKFGPRITSLIGSIFFALGYILASFAGNSFFLIIISLGIIAGIGVGFGYVCPMSTGMKWFPKNRGLITGIAVAGFGGGAIILNYVVEYFVFNMNLVIGDVFLIIGIYFGLAAVISSLFLAEPLNHGYYVEKNNKISIKEHVFSKSFFTIILGMFAGTFSGLLIIGNLKPMMLSLGVGEFFATLSISIFSLGNITGRILWGKIYDRFKSAKTIKLSLISIFLTFVFFTLKLQVEFLIIVIFFAGMGFGGCFVVYASSVVEKFGMKLFSFLYPICFLSYGLAALIGPSTAGYLKDMSGSYSYAINVCIAMLFIVLIINYITEKRIKKV
ncbi:MAG: MFS transporter [Candidatus Muirbacterium halophilum]|nr:MFS transporter [Candidatus Muirbacterium halophilum]MCK9475133.1 MFS transporter [Candidatus Muirbacterium halophilum]